MMLWRFSCKFSARPRKCGAGSQVACGTHGLHDTGRHGLPATTSSGDQRQAGGDGGCVHVRGLAKKRCLQPSGRRASLTGSMPSSEIALMATTPPVD